MKIKILITCFENFLDNKGNPTPLLAEELKNKLSSEFEVSTLLLPVSFKRSFEVLESHLENEKPAYIFQLGLASSRQKIGLEKFGLNYNYCPESPDNDGYKTTGSPIVDNGPTVITHTHFSLEDKVSFLKAKHSLKLEVSAHAGTYVCNSLYFQTMLRYPNIPTLFIHVPQIKELDQQATSEQVELVHSLEIIIRELGRTNFDRDS